MEHKLQTNMGDKTGDKLGDKPTDPRPADEQNGTQDWRQDQGGGHSIPHQVENKTRDKLGDKPTKPQHPNDTGDKLDDKIGDKHWTRHSRQADTLRKHCQPQRLTLWKGTISGTEKMKND